VIRIKVIPRGEREPGILPVVSDCVAAGLDHHVKWEEVSQAAIEAYRKVNR
jgi:hypothetical protein